MNRRHRGPARTAFAVLALSASALASQELPVDCSTAPVVPNQVALTWPDVPTEEAVATLPSSSTLLLLASSSGKGRDVDVRVHLVAGGERVDTMLESFTLAPFETLTTAVRLDGLGVDISALDFSGTVFLEAEIRDTASGEVVDRSYSPLLCFHQEPDPSGGPDLTLVYGREARRMHYFGGDLKSAIFTSVPPRNVLGVFDGGAGRGFEAEDFGPRPPRGGGPGLGNIGWLPPQPEGDGVWEFCMRWVYQSIDSGFGEDHYQQGHLMKARGMKITIDHANWAQPRTFYCNTINGCVSFESDENTGFLVTVHAEARVGGDKQLFVKAFDTKADAISDPDNPPVWMFVANPGGQPRRVYYQNEASEESNLMAFGSFTLHWIDNVTSPGLPGPDTLFMLTDNPDCAGSCQSTKYAEIQPGSSNRKFLVSHEVGHWINREWVGNDMGYNNGTWTANSGDPDCAFAGVGSHAMRSKEYSVAAFIEGFAHYLGAITWNDYNQSSGIFKYYKEIGDAAYADMAEDNWRVDLEGAGADPLGGVSNWMANMCTVHDGHGVEMDWMRFLWDYRTNNNLLPRPDHHDIFRLIQFTRSDHPWADNLHAYDAMLEAIQDPALGQLMFVDRWETLAAFNGVAQ